MVIPENVLTKLNKYTYRDVGEMVKCLFILSIHIQSMYDIYLEILPFLKATFHKTIHF